MQRIKIIKKFRDELPSIVLLFICYAAFIALTLYANQIGIGITIILLIPVLVLHSSLQHEFIHGHPTPHQTINDLLVFPAISLFIPYVRFKDTHLAHHFDPNLTDPYDDPESNFLDPKVWNKLPQWQKATYNYNNTLFGRMTLGPLIGLMHFYKSDGVEIIKLNKRILYAYLHHALGLALVFIWILDYASLPLWALVIASYGSISVLKIRTFLEHKAHERIPSRTVLIEDRGLLSLLFLNNNFHAIHHAYPKLVWHKLPQKFYKRKNEYLKRNDGYWFQSYLSVFQLYLFTKKDSVPHPLMEGFEPKHDTKSSNHHNADIIKAEH